MESPVSACCKPNRLSRLTDRCEGSQTPLWEFDGHLTEVSYVVSTSLPRDFDAIEAENVAPLIQSLIALSGERGQPSCCEHILSVNRPIMNQRFITAQWIPYTVDLAFAFFANPNNLPLLMPERLKMRIDKLEVASAPPNRLIGGSRLVRQDVAAGVGTQMEISFRPMSYVPLRLSWAARITEFVWHSHFCDEQVRGPFEFFRHRHGIRPEIQQGRVGTQLTDEVEFSLPLGSVGHLWDKAVQRRMKEMFRIRQERLPAILGAMVRQTS